MCGSAALLQTGINAEPAVRAALKLLDSRGPDGSGVLRNGQGAVGHCRLALRDFAGGAQPLTLPDGTTLAFVGELYNDHKLRQLLQLSGWSPQNSSDTEVLAEAITRWGDEAWQKLDGMFSIMLLSPDGKTLKIVRDAFGIKPAYYSIGDNLTAAASEPAAVLEMTGFRPAATRPVLHFLMTSQIAWCSETVWQGISSASPRHVTTLCQNEAASLHWSKRTKPADTQPVSPSKLTYLLGEAVYRQTQADFPIGVLLSGGLDSSILAAHYARQVSQPIRTYAVALEGEHTDLQSAREIATHLGTAHHEMSVSIESFFSGMRDLTIKRGLPVSLPNEVLIFRIAQRAHQDVKAVLSGEGADELFGGYRRLLARLNQNALLSANAIGDYRAASAWFTNTDLVHCLKDASALTETTQRDADFVMQSSALFSLPGDPRALLLSDHFPHLLARLDGATMAASIEGRVPFTDPDVVDFALALEPPDLLPQFGLEKTVLRKSALGLLPDSFLHRPKHAFSASLPLLFSNSMGQEKLKQALAQPLIAKLFDLEKLEQLLNDDFRNQVFHRTWLICSLGMWSLYCRVNEVC